MGDARRLINAHLHRMHLGHGTLCLHAVALRCPGDCGTVVLLGGHGAGKTLVAIALAEQGWWPVAGDLVLLDVGHVPAFRGGTSAFLARSDALRRWFPNMPAGSSHEEKVDLRSQWDDGGGDDLGRTAPLLAAVLVDVDGDPRAHTAGLGLADGHTAATAWLRASTHVLDRILDSSSTVLRLVESADGAHHRVALIRRLARHVPLHMAWGAPQRIAAQVDQLTRAVPIPSGGAAW
ncbi:hypothetical protein HUX53_09645 [Actinomadura sp. BRA 177]|nr:hypothetical protein [Actinomadura sp. BRA 177]